MAERKAPMVLGIGAALAGVFLLFRKKKPTLPEPPADGVVVGLLNPPSGGTMWTMVLTDWDITIPIREISGKERLDIAEAAAFEIPSGAMFPLRVVSLTITRWKDGVVGGTVQQLYSVQSYRPIKPFTDDEPDPTYKEVFIPDYGSFYYDVATERFEQ